MASSQPKSKGSRPERKQFHKLKNDESRTWDVEPLYLTPDGIKRLEQELARVQKSLSNLAAETARTAAYGDRSDNAEYKQAKGALRFAHRRIFELEQQLKRAVAIPSGPSASGTVQLGSKVVLEIGGGEKTFEIVGPSETDPSRGRISHESPLGVALVGHREGDVVVLKTEGSSREYRITKVL
jgi:transcription elongation GreA/GreB family factor